MKKKIYEKLYKKLDKLHNNYRKIKNTKYGDYCNFAHHCEVKDSVIGNRTSIGRYTKVQDAIIGSYCSISWNVSIGALNHPMSRISTSAFTYRKLFGIVNEDKQIYNLKTTIGNDVWIGCNAVILAGVNIGNGAVIAAGAIVTKDVEPYSIVGGVPAKLLKYRFDKETIDKLEKINWWEFDDNTIKSNIKIFEKDLDKKTLKKLSDLKNKNEKAFN